MKNYFLIYSDAQKTVMLAYLFLGLSVLFFFSKQNSVTCWICGVLKSVVALTLQEKVKLHVVF